MAGSWLYGSATYFAKARCPEPKSVPMTTPVRIRVRMLSPAHPRGQREHQAATASSPSGERKALDRGDRQPEEDSGDRTECRAARNAKDVGCGPGVAKQDLIGALPAAASARADGEAPTTRPAHLEHDGAHVVGHARVAARQCGPQHPNDVTQRDRKAADRPCSGPPSSPGARSDARSHAGKARARNDHRGATPGSESSASSRAAVGSW